MTDPMSSNNAITVFLSGSLSLHLTSTFPPFPIPTYPPASRLIVPFSVMFNLPTATKCIPGLKPAVILVGDSFSAYHQRLYT